MCLRDSFPRALAPTNRPRTWEPRGAKGPPSSPGVTSATREGGSVELGVWAAARRTHPLSHHIGKPCWLPGGRGPRCRLVAPIQTAKALAPSRPLEIIYLPKASLMLQYGNASIGPKPLLFPIEWKGRSFRDEDYHMVKSINCIIFTFNTVHLESRKARA